MGGFGVAYLAVGAGAGDIVAFVGRHSGGRIIKVVVDSGERNDEAEKGGAGWGSGSSVSLGLSLLANCYDNPPIPPMSPLFHTVGVWCQRGDQRNDIPRPHALKTYLAFLSILRISFKCDTLTSDHGSSLYWAVNRLINYADRLFTSPYDLFAGNSSQKLECDSRNCSLGMRSQTNDSIWKIWRDFRKWLGRASHAVQYPLRVSC